MPLLHIAACSATHHYFSVGFCLLSGEAENDYLWALQQFRDVVRQDIKLPDVILTDDTAALKNSLNSIFPSVPQLLCEFHINKNVESRLSKTFNSIEERDAARQAWFQVIKAPTEEDFNTNWDTFKRQYSAHQELVEYLRNT
jgi:transposase-like protein